MCFFLLISEESRVHHTGLTDNLTWTELLVTSTDCVLIASMALMNDDGLSIYLSIYGSTALVDLGRLFTSLILYTVGRTPWTGDQSVARPLTTHRTTQGQNKRTQISMPWVGFEPTIPLFERAMRVRALDRAATVFGKRWQCHIKYRRRDSISEEWKTFLLNTIS
jgi:hypothetical protein